jgi:hypothetical protein
MHTCARERVYVHHNYISPPSSIFVMPTAAATAASATETSSHPLLIRIAVKIEASGPH